MVHLFKSSTNANITMRNLEFPLRQDLTTSETAVKKLLLTCGGTTLSGMFGPLSRLTITSRFMRVSRLQVLDTAWPVRISSCPQKKS